MPTSLTAGQPAPDFALVDQDGKTHRLADYRGRNVVLYFYPKDETRGCTIEACEFRDEHSALQALGAVVIGVSRDDQESHLAFIEHHALPFPLLVDTDTAVSAAYGAWGPRVVDGQEQIGLIRSTFLIGPDGTIAHVWAPVTAEGHANQVKAVLEEQRARA
ncbi:MAG: peroxiredoxin [Dehalococcoidia bacterium]